MNLFNQPTPKDVKTYVGFAMNEPSNLDYDQALMLASIQFGMGKKDVQAFLFKAIDTTKIAVVKSAEIH